MVADFLINLVYTFGYIGLFAASAIGSASVILPVPVFLLVFTAGSLLDPFFVGIIAGLGSAIGEMTAYAIGLGGRKLVDKKAKTKKINEIEKWLKQGQAWMNKHGGFIVVFIFAATPLPDDVIGIICGSIKYDMKKFFLATILGKIVLSLFLSYAGFYGIGWILNYMNG